MELTKEELKVILDVINVYDPEEIKVVFPEMATHEFLNEVRETFQKVLHLVAKGVDLVEKPVILKE
jgi:intracellular sulfur oxidation DsrE/DsrF family protein